MVGEKIMTRIKAFFIWLFKNRKVAISAIAYGIAIGQKVSKLTKTDKDDLAAQYLADTFRTLTKGLSDDDKLAVAQSINDEKNGILKNLSFDYNVGKQKATIGIGPFSITK
jgi:hypothetical protein